MPAKKKTYNDIESLTAAIEEKEIKNLDPGIIEKIPDRVFTFNGQKNGSELQKNFTGQLTKEQLDRMATVSGDGVYFLRSKKICALEDLNSIDKKVFSTLAPKTIATLTNKQVGALDEEHIGAITTEQAKSLTKGQIGALIFGNKLQYLSEDVLNQLQENKKIKTSVKFPIYRDKEVEVKANFKDGSDPNKIKEAIKTNVSEEKKKEEEKEEELEEGSYKEEEESEKEESEEEESEKEESEKEESEEEESEKEESEEEESEKEESEEEESEKE
ncbi:MAG: hypothetical protein LBI70_03710, partial [Rickettsiales bacterium]|nr:hypothetical protein [Rickettsiales bacterium]